MNPGAFAMLVVVVVMVATLGYLFFSQVRSIQNERRRGQKIWKNFGLSLSLMILFLVSWFGQGIAQWQEYTDHQQQHGQPSEIGGFMAEFSSASLENWQSEFLQLFAFVVLSALFIHKGSAESKDSDDEMLQALKRIEKKLDTEPASSR